MAGIGLTPGRPMTAEDIRDLQCWARHTRRASGRRRVLGCSLLGHQRTKTIERALDLANRVGGDGGVERRGLELGMSK